MADCSLPFNVEILSSDRGATFACGEGTGTERKRKDPENERISKKNKK
jgi:hypothetical protein